MKFIRFKPIYLERIWGGSKLKELFNRNSESSASNIGESWEITDRPDAVSVAKGGRFDNMSLSQILSQNQEYIMGKKWTHPFPILVKWIDASQPLSIQVHPNSETAKKLKAESKNENWFIVQADKQSTIIVGFKPSVKSTNESNLSNGTWLRKNLNVLKAKQGDSIFIEAGCVHAIGKGNLILEIQENSDTTYRLYDWDRTDSFGNSRKLHIKESTECIDFSAPVSIIETISTPQKQGTITLDDTDLLCDFDSFEIRHIKLSKNASIELNAGEAKIISVVQGSLSDDNSNMISLSENILLPAAETLKLTALNNSEILITKVKI